MTFRGFIHTLGAFLMAAAQFQTPRIVLRAPAASAATVTPQPEGNDTMNWLKLLNLIPVLAAGVNVFHSGKPLADKQTLAQEAFSLAVAGAQAVAPASEQDTITSVASVGQTALSGVLASLHNDTPAPVVG